jgi:uncharacterized protein YndB with AHSA1/START domain
MRNDLVAYLEKDMTTAVQDKIEREAVYRQPVERVWSALTDPDQLKKWFGSNTAEIDLRPGGAMHLVWEDMDARAIVHTVNPTSHLAWRWKPGGIEDDKSRPLAEQGPLTLVQFFLEPVDGGTRLRVVESGFSAFTEEQRIEALAQNNGGWDHCFAGLDALLGGEDGR